MKSPQALIRPRIVASHASPPRSSLWSNQTSRPAARRASHTRLAASASSEAWLRKMALAESLIIGDDIPQSRADPEPGPLHFNFCAMGPKEAERARGDTHEPQGLFVAAF